MPDPAAEPPSDDPKSARRRLWRRRLGWTALLLAVLQLPIANWAPNRWIAGAAKFGLACLAIFGLVWLFREIWRRLLWRVGRRLAFSYFLVGVLPLALIAILLALTGYLFGGFLLGHLFRDATDLLHRDLVAAALAHIDDPGAEAPAMTHGSLRSADYRNDELVSGDEGAPPRWPGWVDETAAEDERPGAQRMAYVTLPDGRLAAAAGTKFRERATLVWFDGDLEAHLRERTGSWVSLIRSDVEGGLPITRIQLAGDEFTLRGLKWSLSEQELAEYYRLNPIAAAEPKLKEKPFLIWMQRSDRLTTLAGEPIPDVSVAASLAISPDALFARILSTSERVDSAAWIALAGTTVLLLEIWFWAALMALFMIIGLSRAVNRLSKATAAIAEGDFSTRIKVKRKDQLGALQRSFNTMTERLEELVHTAAQKEALDQELALARRVQRDLLPDLIETRAGVEVATTFEPSAAIGGDYFDVLSRPKDRIAVAIADVAGHGLAAGLRMAMVKSALTILAEEELTPLEILARLHRLLRNRSGERGFVTLTLAELVPATGELDLTNAGHPPCYLVRAAGEVEEIALPSSPLGGLPGPPATACVQLESGDAVIWLSDGIAECASPDGDPFGYERIPDALRGTFESAAELRDRLMEAVRTHCAGLPCEDDRTLVVLRYAPLAASKPSAA